LKKYLLLLSAIFSFLTVIAHAEVPNLNTVLLGEAFPHPDTEKQLDIDRPTTQFKVPNYGEGSEIFSEYEVVILNSSKTIVIVSAANISYTQAECSDKLKLFQNILQTRYKNYSLTEKGKKNLKDVTEYSSEGNNEYYGLDCVKSYGPFWTLHYQIRGIKEDELLKNEWEKYFENK